MNNNKMLSRSLENDVAVVGIGGAGTNIAFCFEKLGYPTIHINSSTQLELSKIIKLDTQPNLKREVI